MSASAEADEPGQGPELSAVDGGDDQSTVDWSALPDPLPPRLAEISAEMCLHQSSYIVEAINSDLGSHMAD
ncbi:hypothetical protein [Kutzneria sp. 744]|uniref:hypothetical protein n=1 Tax=Kutzneria sp. (strain 744) TaxID=345341 RepID=UPI0004BAE535|nr:hypothetical protein [Kutzneria sp. 744]